MIDLLDAVVLDSPLSWIALGCTIAVTAIVPSFFHVRLLCGIFMAQLDLVLNAVPIIGGLTTQQVSPARALHFYIVEFSFLLIVFWGYSRILRRRERVLLALDEFFSGKGAWILTAFIAMVCAINFAMVPTDGSSRIEFMTSDWFSYLKPFIQLAMPSAYIGVFVMLRNHQRRWLGY